MPAYITYIPYLSIHVGIYSLLTERYGCMNALVTQVGNYLVPSQLADSDSGGSLPRYPKTGHSGMYLSM